MPPKRPRKRSPWQIGCIGSLLIIALAVVLIAFATLIPIVPAPFVAFVADWAIWLALGVGVVVFLVARARE